MPRDSGGIGKTGKKHKAALKRWLAQKEGAQSTASSTGASAGASTVDDEPEEPPAAGSAAPVAAAATAAAKPVVAEVTRGKRVSFAPLPPRVEGRFTRPRSEGWTWGGRFDHRDEVMRAVMTTEARWGRCMSDKHGMHALKAALWGFRVAEHVSAGCVGEWTDKYTDTVPWIAKRSHRRWCPHELPADHEDHLLVGLINAI